jgi:regulator of nonsense transcripts 1
VNSCLWDPFDYGLAVLKLRFDVFKVRVGQEVRLILPNYPMPESRTIWLAEIKEIHNMELIIRVEHGIHQVPPRHDSSFEYVLHIDAWTDVVFERMNTAISNVVTARVADPIIRGIVRGSLDLPAPTVSPAAFLSSAHLNESQNRAVAMALSNPASLIQGPPGSGKSYTLVEIVRRALADGKVLVCAPSNIVADDLAAKISRLVPKPDVVRVPARSREVVETTVNHLMLHTICSAEDSYYAQRKRQIQRCAIKGASKVAAKKYCRSVEMKRIRKAQVVVMTCVCAGDERVAGSMFHTVVVDEATQAVEPGCLIPVTLASVRVVLIGDHKQLGPLVNNPTAKRAGFDISMFERLIGLNLPKTRLDIQYRMHPAISAFSCRQFYDGTLEDGVTAAARTKLGSSFPWPDTKHPMFFWHVSGQEELDSRGNSYMNRHEALKVQEVVNRLLDDSKDVGVITFYSAQKELLMSKFPNSLSGTPEIASVDGFQGREKDFIVLSTVRAEEIGFLREYRRLNVAMTRAKYGLVICGNVHTMLASKDPTWVALLMHLHAKSAVFTGTSLRSLERLNVSI